MSEKNWCFSNQAKEINNRKKTLPIVSKLMEKKTKDKQQQQEELTSYYTAWQLALKLLANVGYGAFARKEFAYSEYRVSEIITGYGRLIHKQMEKIAFECYGFQTGFGFIDWIFIRHSTASSASANTTTIASMLIAIITTTIRTVLPKKRAKTRIPVRLFKNISKYL
jgi:DNA polymerase elongation subunit (family B)